MKKMRLIPVLAILMVLYVLSTVGHYIISEKADMSQREGSVILTERIHDAIESKLKGPIMVAKAMAGDSFLLNELEKEQDYSENDIINIMKEYLGNIKNDTGCDAAFFISDASKRYYTHNGLNKVINPEGNRHDIWYKVFLGNGLPYALDVDVDENDNREWTVFINVRVEDREGKLVGVCGVGIRMSEIQNMFDRYEREHNIKINLVDSDGLVQVDINNINIKTTYNTNRILSDTEDYVYTKSSQGGYIITKYINELDWYLVVQNEHTASEEKQFKPGIILFGLILFLTATGCCIFVFRKGESKKSKENKNDINDVTGVPDRNYFKEVYGEQNHFNTTKYKSVAVFDIDHFSSVVNHMDGDVILRSVTDCAREIMGDECEIFRWGEDEFTVFMDWSIEFAYNICNEFCREIDRQGYVTVSVGVTEVILSDTIMKNYYRAVQGCFLVKEMGGNGVKRK